MDPKATNFGLTTGDSSAVHSVSTNPNPASANNAPTLPFAHNQPVLGRQRPVYVELPLEPGFRITWEHETPETVAQAIAAEHCSGITRGKVVSTKPISRKRKSPMDKGSTRASTKDPLLDAPAAHLQAPDMDLFLSDILCFLPRYFSRTDLMERMIKAQLTSSDIAEYINLCRNTQVTHQMVYNESMLPVLYNKGFHDTSLLAPSDDFRVASGGLTKRTLRNGKTGQGKEVKQSDEIPSFSVTVVELAGGVFRWPKGRFLTPFAAAVRHCVIMNDTSWTLETLPKLAAGLGTPMPKLYQGEHYDIVFAQWVKEHLQKGHSCPECMGEPWGKDKIRERKLQETELEGAYQHNQDNSEEPSEDYDCADGLDGYLHDEESLGDYSNVGRSVQPDYRPLPFPHLDTQSSTWQRTKIWNEEFWKWEEQRLAEQ